jgi:hypothetical protein
MEYKVKTNELGRLAAFNEFGDELPIHIVHCAETMEELKNDLATLYIVSEECTNFARIHLTTDFSEEEALQQVYEYLMEEEGIEEPRLLGVFKAKL